MSDTDAMYAFLVERGPVGAHTLELRRRGFSGNPSQRATDIEEKFNVRLSRVREKDPVSGRIGSRYTLVGSSAEGESSGSRPVAVPSAASSESVGEGGTSRGGEPAPLSGESGIEGRGFAGELSAPPQCQPVNATPGVASPEPQSLFDPPSAYDPWENAA